MSLFKDRFASGLKATLKQDASGPLMPRQPTLPETCTGTSSRVSVTISKLTSDGLADGALNSDNKTVQFFCAKSGEPFTLFLVRKLGARFLSILEARPDPKSDGSVWDRLGGRRLNQPTKSEPTRPGPRINLDDCDLGGFQCPYCGTEHVFIYGGCGHLTCGGTVTKREEGEHFQCFCGSGGILTGFIKSLAEKGSTPSHKPTLPGAGLSGPRLTGFPANQKRLTDRTSE